MREAAGDEGKGSMNAWSLASGDKAGDLSSARIPKGRSHQPPHGRTVMVTPAADVTTMSCRAQDVTHASSLGSLSLVHSPAPLSRPARKFSLSKINFSKVRNVY